MTAAIELDAFLAHLNRPGAAAAPTTPRPTPANPFPAPFPSGPRTWPAAQTITVPTIPCCGKLRGDFCHCLDDLDQLLDAIREPIVFPAPMVDRALREVA